MHNNSMFPIHFTSNFGVQGTYSLCQKPKHFYVVFSPLMNFPSRGFLAED